MHFQLSFSSNNVCYVFYCKKCQLLGDNKPKEKAMVLSKYGGHYASE